MATAFVVSRYESILSADTRLIFFIPLIVYVSDAIGLAMWASITSATVFALATATVLNKLNIDPASGADPLVTVTQDVISLLIYFAIASAIIL